jgi:hypothetical protein
MDINFNQKFNMPIEQLIRRCGYGLVRDPRAKQRSYSRRLGQQGFYPRFHLYINSEDPLILSLHIDQKQVSYEGTTAHSGDYDSDLVKQEAQRIHNIIINEAGAESDEQEDNEEEKTGFFNRLFGK